MPGQLLGQPRATSTAEWTGVRLGDVLAAAGPAPGYRARGVRRSDVSQLADPPQPYGASIPVKKAFAAEVLLAWATNGQLLPAARPPSLSCRWISARYQRRKALTRGSGGGTASSPATLSRSAASSSCVSATLVRAHSAGSRTYTSVDSRPPPAAAANSRATMSRSGSAYQVALDLPGVDPERIELICERNGLTIRAERAADLR